MSVESMSLSVYHFCTASGKLLPTHVDATQAGARGLKLTNKDGKTEVEEVWSTRKIQFFHVNSVREGDWVYGSSGARAPALPPGLAGSNSSSGP